MPNTSGAIRAGAAFVEIFADDSTLMRSLNRTEGAAKKWANSLSAAGLKLFGAGAAMLAPLLAATKAYASFGSELAHGAAKTGMSVEALSELKYAASQAGVEIESLEKGLAKMSRAVVGAAQGSPEAAAAFEKLGLSIETLTHLSPEAKFKAIAQALAAIKQPDLRIDLAQQIFGKGGADLLPLLREGSDGITQLMVRARELGLTMSTADAQGALKFNQSLKDLWDVARMGVVTIGGALAPVVDHYVKVLTSAAQTVRTFINEHRQLVQVVAGVAAGMVGLGAAMVAGSVALRVVAGGLGAVSGALGLVNRSLRLVGSVAGIAFSGFATGGQLVMGAMGQILPVLRTVGSATLFALNPFKLFPAVAGLMGTAISAVAAGITAVATTIGGIAAAVLSPMVLLGAAVVGVAGYFLYTSGVAGKAMGAIKGAVGNASTYIGNAFSSVATYLKAVWSDVAADSLTAFHGVRDAISGDDWGLAARILWTYVKLEFAKGSNAVMSVWLTAKGALHETWADLSSGISTVWSYLKEYMSNWDGVKAATQKIATWIGATFSNLVSHVADTLQQLFMTTGKKQLVVELKQIDEREASGYYDKDAAKNKALADRERKAAQATFGDYDDKARTARDSQAAAAYAAKQKALDDAYAAKQPGAVKEAEDTRSKIELERAEDRRKIEEQIAKLKAEKQIAGWKAELAGMTAQAAKEAKERPALTPPKTTPDDDAEGLSTDSKKTDGTFNAGVAFGLGGGVGTQLTNNTATANTFLGGILAEVKNTTKAVTSWVGKVASVAAGKPFSQTKSPDVTFATAQPPEAPSAPNAPSAPAAPVAPNAPEAPLSPNAPAAPAAPSAPVAPSAPEAPAAPQAPPAAKAPPSGLAPAGANDAVARLAGAAVRYKAEQERVGRASAAEDATAIHEGQTQPTAKQREVRETDNASQAAAQAAVANAAAKAARETAKNAGEGHPDLDLAATQAELAAVKANMRDDSAWRAEQRARQATHASGADLPRSPAARAVTTPATPDITVEPLSPESTASQRQERMDRIASAADNERRAHDARMAEAEKRTTAADAARHARMDGITEETAPEMPAMTLAPNENIIQPPAVPAPAVNVAVPKQVSPMVPFNDQQKEYDVRQRVEAMQPPMDGWGVTQKTWEPGKGETYDGEIARREALARKEQEDYLSKKKTESAHSEELRKQGLARDYARQDQERAALYQKAREQWGLPPETPGMVTGPSQEPTSEKTPTVQPPTIVQSPRQQVQQPDAPQVDVAPAAINLPDTPEPDETGNGFIGKLLAQMKTAHQTVRHVLSDAMKSMQTEAIAPAPEQSDLPSMVGPFEDSQPDAAQTTPRFNAQEITSNLQSAIANIHAPDVTRGGADAKNGGKDFSEQIVKNTAPLSDLLQGVIDAIGKIKGPTFG